MLLHIRDVTYRLSFTHRRVNKVYKNIGVEKIAFIVTVLYPKFGTRCCTLMHPHSILGTDLMLFVQDVLPQL